MLRYLSTMLDSFFPHECAFPLQTAGRSGEQVENAEQLLNHLQRYFILFTYRTGFPGIQTTTNVIHSDQGWGCLLRTSQMLLAHFLRLYVVPETAEGHPAAAADAASGGLLQLFFDEKSDSAPFSIHNMIASVWDRKAFRAEYWSPSQGCEALRKTVGQAVASGALPVPVSVVCSSNGCLVAEDVILALRGESHAVLLLTPVRVSAAQQLTQEAYLQVEELMSHPACLGVVGGVPGKSYYFFGHSQTQLLYLDPHQHTQPALRSTQLDLRGVVIPSLDDVRCVDWSRVDTSLFFAFGLCTMADWTNLATCLSTARFLCVEQRRSLSDYEVQREQRHRAQAYMSPLHHSNVGLSKRQRPLAGHEDDIASAPTSSSVRVGSKADRVGGGAEPQGHQESDNDSWDILSDLEHSLNRASTDSP